MILADPPSPSYPQWWLDGGLVPNGQPPVPADGAPYYAWVQANYAPANLGQVKNFAAKAAAYLDTELASVGGAGSTITAMVNGFSTNVTIDYQPANLGQLKAVAQPFYDRLLEVGYNTKANLNYQMTGNATATTWAYNYPWNPSTPYAENYAPVNLGQLKLVFSFDLSSESFSLTDVQDDLSNGLPDAWLTNLDLYPLYGSSGATGDASTTYAHLDEYGSSLGHDPESADNADVGLLVFTDLQ